MQREFYAYYSEIEDRHWWFVGRREVILGMLERELETRTSGLRLLDVGCGTGTMVGHLMRFGAAQGVDAEPEAVRFCHRRGVTNVEVFDGRQLPFADESFDFVGAFDVIEHIEDDVGMLSEMRRVLRPHGVALVTVPAFAWLWGPQDEIAHHKRRYRRRELNGLLLDSGFAVRRLTFFNTILFWPIAAIRLLRPYRPGSADLRSDFELTKPGPLNYVLGRVFAAEAPVVSRMNLPVGVSLLALANRS